MSENIKKPTKESKPLVLKKVAFLVGSTVYLKTDLKQLPRMVLHVHLGPNGYTYELRHSDEDSTVHYDIEISDERAFVPADDEEEDEE